MDLGCKKIRKLGNFVNIEDMYKYDESKIIHIHLKIAVVANL